MKKLSLFILILSLLMKVTASAAGEDVLSNILSDTPEPQVASVGGEWAVIALARSGTIVPDGYYENYEARAAEFINSGSARKYTDYARVLLALTAIGAGSYGAERFLDDYDAVTAQGINGAVYALIALDSGGYESKQRENYIDFILKCQHTDGGFGLLDSSDTDITAMAIQALAPYRDRKNINAAVDSAAEYIRQAEITTCESAAQCVIAFCALEMDADSFYDELMKYYSGGRFAHIIGAQADQMATEQGALACAAMARRRSGAAPLYDMSGVYANESGFGTDALTVFTKTAAAAVGTGFMVMGALWSR